MTDLEATLRPHIVAMWAERDQIVGRVAQAVTASVDSYATTPSSEVWIGMLRILERAVQGNPFRPATDEDRVAAIGTGVQGAGAGIAADDLVTAVLLGAREVESDVLGRAEKAGVDAADVLEASRRFRRWAEQAAVWALQGLVGAQSHARTPHVRQMRLIAELRAGNLDAARELVEELGLDPAVSWFAVVVAGPRGVPTGPAMTVRLASPDAVWGELPGSDEAGELAGLVRWPIDVPDELVVGVGGPAPLNELVEAFRDAARAARAARHFGRSGKTTLSDLGLLLPLYEDPALADRLLERWVAPLSAEPRHDLEDTLRAWFANDGHVDDVARDLRVHANTVRNRLARITRLVGEDWRAPQHRAELWAALQIRR